MTLQGLGDRATCTVDEAAQLLGISRGTAYEAVRTGEFPCRTLRVGRRILVPVASLRAALGEGSEV
jgi:excisionase family DNA binding protein